MSESKGCKYCLDEGGDCVFPYHGLAPHNHDLSKTGSFIGSTVFLPKDQWPENFSQDKESDEMGIYTHCPKCGWANQ